jgi:hypothetical protein
VFTKTNTPTSFADTTRRCARRSPRRTIDRHVAQLNQIVRVVTIAPSDLTPGIVAAAQRGGQSNAATKENHQHA